MADASLTIRRIDQNHYEVNLITADYYIDRIRRSLWSFKVQDNNDDVVHKQNIDGDLEKVLEVVDQYYRGTLT